MKELKNKILEALVSALPITVIVYLMALTPLFGFSKTELITFTLGAIGLVMGVLVVLAEPAIHVLNQQVEDVTGGTVSRRSMMIGLCCGMLSAWWRWWR